MACEKTKEWLRKNFSKAPAKELNTAVNACCGKLSLETTYKTAGLKNTSDPACDRALHSLAAASICNYYSSGACAPCCSKLAAFIGPIMSASISAVVDTAGSIISSVSAKGKFDWYSYVTEPQVKHAMKVERDMMDGVSRIFMEMLYDKGLSKSPLFFAGPGGMPDDLRWPTFAAKYIPKDSARDSLSLQGWSSALGSALDTIGPSAGGSNAIYGASLSEYVRNLAVLNGYHDYHDVMLLKGGPFAKVWDKNKCIALRNGIVKDAAWCVDLQGTSDDKHDPEAVSAALGRALYYYRTIPLRDAITEAVGKVANGLDAYQLANHSKINLENLFGNRNKPALLIGNRNKPALLIPSKVFARKPAMVIPANLLGSGSLKRQLASQGSVARAWAWSKSNPEYAIPAASLGVLVLALAIDRLAKS